MKKSIAAALLSFLLIFALTNCSDQTAQGVTDSEIVLGIHTDISGPVSSFGKYSVEGIQMRIDEINFEGGIHGRKLSIIAEDHQYQVPRAVQAANKLLNKDKVFLMIGNLGTPQNNAVFKLQEEKNVPNLFPLSAARSMTEPFHRLKFGGLSTYYDQSRAGIKWAVEVQGKSKVCVLYEDNDFGQEIYEATVDQLAAMNMQLAEKATNKPTDTDLTSQITKLKNANCDAIAMGTIVKDTIKAWKLHKRMTSNLIVPAGTVLFSFMDVRMSVTVGLD